MKRILMVLLVTSLRAMESWDAIVNLGDIQVKFQLKNHKVACEDSPFDCLDATSEGIVKMLEDRFEGFFERGNNLRFSHDDALYDKKYEAWLSGPLIDMPHEVTSFDVKAWLKGKANTNFSKIKAKHEVRIKALLELLSSKKKILFFRKDITREQAKLLDLALNRLYSDIAYCLVVLGSTDEYQKDWGLKRARNYFLNLHDLWMDDAKAWSTIFRTLGLLST